MHTKLTSFGCCFLVGFVLTAYTSTHTYFTLETVYTNTHNHIAECICIGNKHFYTGSALYLCTSAFETRESTAFGAFETKHNANITSSCAVILLISITYEVHTMNLHNRNIFLFTCVWHIHFFKLFARETFKMFFFCACAALYMYALMYLHIYKYNYIYL